MFLGLLQSLAFFLASFLGDGPGGCCGLVALFGSIALLAYLAGRAAGRRTGQQGAGLRAGAICALVGRGFSVGLCFALSAALAWVIGPQESLLAEEARSRLSFALLACGVLLLIDVVLGLFGGWMGGNHGAAEAYASSE
jgi:hypothetical protein